MTNDVNIINTNAILVTMMDWDTQSHYFLSGLSYGIPIALSLLVVYWVAHAVRPPHFPTD